MYFYKDGKFTKVPNPTAIDENSRADELHEAIIKEGYEYDKYAFIKPSDGISTRIYHRVLDAPKYKYVVLFNDLDEQEIIFCNEWWDVTRFIRENCIFNHSEAMSIICERLEAIEALLKPKASKAKTVTDKK